MQALIHTRKKKKSKSLKKESIVYPGMGVPTCLLFQDLIFFLIISIMTLSENSEVTKKHKFKKSNYLMN